MAGVLGLALADCATPGPLHLYSLPTASANAIADTGADHTADTPSFLAPGEVIIGFAYDLFTDHFFLRLAPGDRIRVVDRPARAVKREFVVAELQTTDAAGDLAVRPRDGHLFALHPTASALIELTRFGNIVRTIPLAGFGAPPLAIAYDPQGNRLFILRIKQHAAWLSTHEIDGRLIREVALSEPASPRSLGFDSATRELYVPLATGQAVGVFDENGQLLRTLARPARFVDVGPRSFLRLF
ncbi:MAG: hypothetical protein EXS32_04250 [Opitutus sp.]|nr:hypothetical protein [Opitutus sp.]